MTTEADIGYGTLFQTGADSSPEVWTTMGEVTNITPPALSRDSIDASHEQSPNGWREFIPGLKDGGEVSIELNYVVGSTSTLALVAELNASGQSAVKPRRILFTDGSFWEFDAFLTGFEPEAPLDDKMVASVTFKVSGQPLLTQAV